MRCRTNPKYLIGETPLDITVMQIKISSHSYSVTRPPASSFWRTWD